MIQILIDFDINLYAIILLLVMLVVISLKRDIFRYSTHLLRIIIWMTLFALIIEPITWIFDNDPAILPSMINHVSNFLLMLMAPVLTGVWGCYIDYKIFSNRERLKKRHYYQIPTYVTFILLIINMFYPIFYEIDASSHFSMASLVWIRYIIIYGFYLYIMLFVFMNRKHVRTNVLYGIIAFFLLPALGSVIQIVDSSLLLSWSMLALSTVVVYIFLETTTGIRDYLTQLYSRRTLEDYIANLAEANHHFTVLMIDLNSFKKVNDTFGHLAGDQVLIAFAKLLKVIFLNDKMISRFGGDEFFVVIESLNSPGIEKSIKHLRESVLKDPLLKEFHLIGFSVGISAFDGNKTLDELYLEADQRMYGNKNSAHK
jgi:diguanylate cyclase (GGDEF)-like protein